MKFAAYCVQLNRECSQYAGEKIYIIGNKTDLAAEWNHKKNGILKPEDIAHKSGKKVWWIQDDKNPVNDKLIKFEWEDTVIHRSVDGRGNPFKIWA